MSPCPRAGSNSVREGVLELLLGKGLGLGKGVMGAEASSEAVMSNNSLPICREREPSDHSTILELACGIYRDVSVRRRIY